MDSTLKDVWINLRHISHLDIDLWTMPKPTVEETPHLKPVYKLMERSDLNTSNDSLKLATGSINKLARHKNAQKAVVTIRPKTKQAKIIKKPKNTASSTPQLNRRVKRVQKICTGL